MPTTYRIRSPRALYTVTESGGTVIKSDIEVLEHLPFSYARDLFKAKGWQVIPVPDEEHPSSISYKGKTYDLIWSDDTVISIIESDEYGEREITWNDLPSPIKQIL